MNKFGRLFMALFLVLVSQTIFAQTGTRDLQTELRKFWPVAEDYGRNVWGTVPIKISSMDIYPNGGVAFNAIIGSNMEEFSVVNLAVFDSEVYKLMYPGSRNFPLVKGTIFQLQAKYRPDQTYFAIIHDNAVIEKNMNNYNQKDRFDQSFRRITFTEGSRLLENGKTVFEHSDDGQTLGTYNITNSSGNAGVFIPNTYSLIQVFEVANPVGSFMQAHRGQKLEQVSLGSLDKTRPKALSIVNGFPNDYLYPFGIAFVFDGKTEAYRMYRLSSGDNIIAGLNFYMNWQP